MTRAEEIKIKEKRLYELMDKFQLEGILLKRQANYSWFTAGGINMVVTATDLGFSSLLITKKERFCIANRIESKRNMEEEGLHELGFSLLEYEWYDNNEMGCINRVLSFNNIGTDVPIEGMKFIEEEIKKIRYSLLPPEVDRYLWLGKKTSEAIESVLMEVKPGMTEAEITGELTKLLWKDRIDQVGYQAATDERVYKYRHPIPTERKIGKYMMLCVMARKWGLITTITRLLSFGKLPENIKKQYEDNVYIECAMIAATRPGKKVKEIFLLSKKLYNKLGYKDEWRFHHQGGAMGYDVRDYIVNEKCEEVVHENQCFCWNPSISGTKSEDGFITTRSGFTFITKPVLYPTLKISIDEIDFIRPAILEK